MQADKILETTTQNKRASCSGERKWLRHKTHSRRRERLNRKRVLGCLEKELACRRGKELPRKLLAETLSALFLTVCVDSADNSDNDHTHLGHFLNSVSTRSDT